MINSVANLKLKELNNTDAKKLKSNIDKRIYKIGRLKMEFHQLRVQE